MHSLDYNCGQRQTASLPKNMSVENFAIRKSTPRIGKENARSLTSRSLKVEIPGKLIHRFPHDKKANPQHHFLLLTFGVTYKKNRTVIFTIYG